MGGSWSGHGRRLAALAAAIGLVVGVVTVGAGAPVAAAAVIHVDPAGGDDAAGTATDPVRTIARAVRLAAAGDRIVVASGTYHEQVQVYDKEVHLAAAPGATVVLDGAREVTGWSRDGDAWAAPWSTAFARAGEPHTFAEIPEAGWPEQFFVDGVQLTEVTERAAVRPGTFHYDVGAGTVSIGDDPAGRLVEGSALAWALYLNRADGSSLGGITVRRYATPHTNMAAIRAYADDLTLTGVTVEDNAYIGVSAIGDRITFDRLTARRNGHLGAHAHRSTAITITDSTIADNNAHGFNFHHAAGGFKVTESTGVVVTGSTVSRNGGPAIWTDLSTADITVARNVVQDNARHGIMLELSTRATVVDNVVTGNANTGIWVLESSDVAVWHNAAYDNFRDLWILDGPRADVFDVRVVNNTFGGGAAGAQSVISVDDWTEDRSTAEMDLTLSANRYWLPDGAPTELISRFAHWPADLELSATISEHRAAAGGLEPDAVGSTAATNPFVRSSTDFRQPADAPIGRALPARVAAVAGRAAGSAHPAGPLSATHGTVAPVPARASGSPPPSPPTGPGSVSTEGSRRIQPAVRLQPPPVAATVSGSAASVAGAPTAPSAAPAIASSVAAGVATDDPAATPATTRRAPAGPAHGWHELAVAVAER